MSTTRLPASKLRKAYIARLIGRCIVLVICAMLWIFSPETFHILKGWNFFKAFSPLHILWLIWMADMFLQLLPVRSRVPLGSQKLFRLHFKPIMEKISPQALKDYMISTAKGAFKVLVLWCLLIGVIGILHHQQILNQTALFMISVLFYVCDLICVLIWCPFRLLMKNRCCTTCRIFNWDHLMMFSPLLFAGGFYAWSLLGTSIVVWLVWEGAVLLYPERFWEYTNTALRCSNCTDKLCTQYCQKLRSKPAAVREDTDK